MYGRAADRAAAWATRVIGAGARIYSSTAENFIRFAAATSRSS